MVAGGKSTWEEKWTPDDLRGITDRIEYAKEQAGSSLASVMEIVELLELLELLEGIVSDFPLPQQRYFRETVNELVALAIGHLEKFRDDFGFLKGEEK